MNYAFFKINFYFHCSTFFRNMDNYLQLNNLMSLTDRRTDTKCEYSGSLVGQKMLSIYILPNSLEW